MLSVVLDTRGAERELDVLLDLPDIGCLEEEQIGARWVWILREKSPVSLRDLYRSRIFIKFDEKFF